MKPCMRRCGWICLLVLSTALPVFAAVGGTPAVSEGAATQADVVMLIVYVLSALIFSFLCSIAEAVMLSVTPSFVEGLEKKGNRTGLLLKNLKANVDRPLAAILTLNTIAHTVGAIGSGAKATQVFGSQFFGIFSAVMTLLILFLSEIIPKTIGAVYWRSLAGVTARFVRVLIILLYPLIRISELLTRLVSRGKGVHAFSREEFQALADIGAREGKLEEKESRILNNLFRFDSLTAQDVMTPRTVMVTYPEDKTVEEVLPDLHDSPFSRFPVYADTRDHMTGFVMKTDILLAGAKDEDERPLSSLKRPLEHVSANLVLSEALEHLLDRHAQLAVVVGDYGGTVGLVTVEDIVETLLGLEIVDEADAVDDMQQLARKKWEERAHRLGLETDALHLHAEDEDA